jgi:hypothetical protein
MDVGEPKDEVKLAFLQLMLALIGRESLGTAPTGIGKCLDRLSCKKYFGISGEELVKDISSRVLAGESVTTVVKSRNGLSDVLGVGAAMLLRVALETDTAVNDLFTIFKEHWDRMVENADVRILDSGFGKRPKLEDAN